jgi:hypothetical protein
MSDQNSRDTVSGLYGTIKTLRAELTALRSQLRVAKEALEFVKGWDSLYDILPDDVVEVIRDALALLPKEEG